MVRRQRGIVESPVLQVVRIPFRQREVNRQLHPVSLRLEITMHRRYLEAYIPFYISYQLFPSHHQLPKKDSFVPE